MSLVRYEKKDKIGYITLNRPEKRNALNDELVAQLAKIWVDFRDDNNLWVAILTGEGKAFCAGAEGSRPGQKVDQTAKPDSLLAISVAFGATPTRYEVWKPIIAALNGYVIGAGLWLALGCDIRIAAEDAELRVPEVKASMIPTFAAFLPNYTPKGIASELLLVGDAIDAQRAFQVGLVNKVVPREQLMSTATALAERLCENGPLALRAIKELIHRGADMDYQSALALTEKISMPVFASEDAKEVIKAFMEKRKPVWKAR